MVAFIGAVICIIAAVHTGSSRAAAASQPPADNQSLYPHGPQTPAESGPLGALHGSESPGAEAPTFNIGLSGGTVDGVVHGLTGHDPAVSRLICTPIPAAECNSRGDLPPQADQATLYTGNDWGHLRVAAEELRQTVLQQKEQISTDQRTIGELTSKLSECERGLDGRGSSERRRGSSAGLRGGKAAGEEAHRDRVMVRDSPEGVHLLTVRVVDELEQAIAQLKDRIEKLEVGKERGTRSLSMVAAKEVDLRIPAKPAQVPANTTDSYELPEHAAATPDEESDIGLLPQNQTDADTSRTPGGGGSSDGPETAYEPGHAADAGEPWRMEDLEEELERKVELLEKERKALRVETQRHRQEIDHGISKLHRRIAGLEEGVSGHLFPEGYRLSFPSRTNYMYAVVMHPIPQLQAFTVCLWLRPTEGGIGTPLSYAVPEQPNELVLLQGLHSPAELLVNDKVAQLPVNLSRGSWQHICVTWSQKGGAWQAYQGGKLRGEGHGLAPGHLLRPGGVLILGQEQDSLGGGFASSQALVGELSQVGLWDRVLTAAQVASLARCGRITQGTVVPWTQKGVEVYGGATKEPGEPCSKHSISSQ